MKTIKSNEGTYRIELELVKLFNERSALLKKQTQGYNELNKLKNAFRNDDTLSIVAKGRHNIVDIDVNKEAIISAINDSLKNIENDIISIQKEIKQYDVVKKVDYAE